MKQDNNLAVKNLLDRWANWIGTGEPLANGAPRQCAMAPDARIHSFEDLEIESEKVIVRAVDACVQGLPAEQRRVVMMYYGFSHTAWRPGDDAVFEAALDNLFQTLRNRVAVCL
ncbi:MAG TPA: hypothetical protein VIF60_22485 [Burkholderiaceae bacterium]